MRRVVGSQAGLVEREATASRLAVEKAEAQTALAGQQVAAEAAHTADLARELRECRAELSRSRVRSDLPCPALSCLALRLLSTAVPLLQPLPASSPSWF